MSFNICRGTLGSLPMFSCDPLRVSRLAAELSAVFRYAKCRYWPIASFRGSAAIGRFGGKRNSSQGVPHRLQFMYAR